MSDRIDDLCARPAGAIEWRGQPHAPAIHPASVYRCESPSQAAALLAGEQAGYIYSRDGHPNADMLAQRCRELHEAERAAVTSSGMSAMALAILSQLSAGDHLLVSRHLYGRSLQLLTDESSRLGIEYTVVDTFDLAAIQDQIRDNTRMLVVETITNPVLRVSDIRALADLAHAHDVVLLVDNTFASPILCRPLQCGADLVIESITKVMNGHSDVLLGLLCGSERLWERVPLALSCWGLTSPSVECWLAQRGLSTMHLRVERACRNAAGLAAMLAGHQGVSSVNYPGLPDHEDHALATAQLDGGFGSMVTFALPGGLAAVERFIAAADDIPFCPSLGELSTTLSHPCSTSHRQLDDQQLASLGIGQGTIRMSVGIESESFVIEAVERALAAARQ